MEKRYSSLRTIASVIKFFAYFFLIISILEVILIFLAGKSANEFLSKDEDDFKQFIDGINNFIGFSTFAILIGGIIIYIMISSLSEIIKLYIDVEHNTRNTQSTLEKILKSLERKFEINSPGPTDTTGNQERDSISRLINNLRENQKLEKKKKVDYERDMECMNQIKYIIDEHNKIEDDDDLKINIYPSYNTEELMFNFRQSKINTMKVISTEKYQMNESYLNRVYSKIEDIYFNYEKDGRSILYPS